MYNNRLIEEVDLKRKYFRPDLIDYGSVAKITQTGNGSVSDSTMTTGSNMEKAMAVLSPNKRTPAKKR